MGQLGGWPLLALLALFRVGNTFLVQTAFDPDEYWQGPEVAHRIVFGYGHLTWEWWPSNALRGFLHPLLFAAVYRLLAIARLDSPFLIQWSPRVLQALFAAAGDWALYRLACRTDPDPSKQSARWALVCQLCSWFTLYAITRTYTSSLEAVLTTAALSLWPLAGLTDEAAGEPSAAGTERGAPQEKGGGGGRGSRRGAALALAAAACVVRPTSAIVWTFLGLWELATCPDPLSFLALQVAPIGAAAVGLSTALDSWMYGTGGVVVAPLNFLGFNFLSSGASAYGTHPAHWYFTQGLPVMLFTLLPFAALGIWRWRSPQLPLLLLWTTALHSVIGHKEFRFLLPMLPLCHLFAGRGIARLHRRWCPGAPSTADPATTDTDNSTASLPAAQLGGGGAPKGSPGAVSGVPAQAQRGRPRLFWWTVGAALALQAAAALYFCLVHQRGSLDVMRFLRTEMGGPGGEGRVRSVAFLMPCHATPFYAHTHASTPMTFLDCSPQFTRPGGAPSETQQFVADPLAFVTKLYGPRGSRCLSLGDEVEGSSGKEGSAGEETEGRSARHRECPSPPPPETPGVPSHLVLFNCDQPSLQPFLDANGYSKVASFFHRHFAVDRDGETEILLYSTSSSSSVPSHE